MWYIKKQSFNAKKTVNRERRKDQGKPHAPSPIWPTAARINPLSHVPNRISCAVFISIIVRKLEEGLVLGPASRRAFPQLSGPAKLLMLTVVRGGEVGGVIAVVIGGGVEGR